MSASASAIRAGRAFVELFVNDETFQRTLKANEAYLRTWGARIDALGAASMESMTARIAASNAASAGSFAASNAASAGSFARMNAAASTSLAQTGSAVTVVSSGMLFLRTTIAAVGNSFRAAFAYVTSSVTKAAAVLGALAFGANRFFKNSPFTKMLNSFLSNSQTTEAVGRMTRFLGNISGSKVLQDMGKRIQRLSLGSAVVAGFQKGIVPGIGASFGAAFRSAKGAVLSGMGSVVAAPIGLLRGGMSGLARVALSPVALLRKGMSGIGSALGAAASGFRPASVGAAIMSSQFSAAAAAARGLSSAMSSVQSVVRAVGGMALKVGALAAAITGPALWAAKTFVSSASEIQTQALQTGESLQSLIDKKFGQSSMISPNDVRSAAALGEAMTALKQATSAAWAQIGIAALPVLRQTTASLLKITTAVVQFIANNRQTIGTIIAVAAKIGAVAGVVVSLMAAFGAATGVVGSVGAAVAGIVPIIAAILSPMGLLVTAVVAAGGAWLYFSGTGSQAIGWLQERFGELYSAFQTVWGGIQDALTAGDLALAGKIAWLGLQVGFQVAVNTMMALWDEWKSFFISVFDSAVSGLAIAMTNTWATMEVAWTETTSAFYQIWIDLTAKLKSAWNTAVSAMQAAWSGMQDRTAKGIAWLIAKLQGLDPAEVLRDLQQMQGHAQQSRQDRSDSAAAAIEKERADALAKSEEARKNARKRIEDMRAGSVAIIGEDADRQAKSRVGAGRDAARERQEELERLQRELQESISQAKKEAARAGVKTPENPDGRLRAPDVSGASRYELTGVRSAATFNASIAGLLGHTTVAPAERAARAAEKQIKVQEKTVEAVKEVTVAVNSSKSKFAE